MKSEICSNFSRIKIIAGRSNRPLADKIIKYLDEPLVDVLFTDFADNEIFVKINEHVRGADVFIIQSGNNPGYKNIMELLIAIDALKRASAARITAVIPYYGYARQDRKSEPRVPITAKLIADLLTSAGASRIMTMDLHAAQIQGFFNIPVDHLYATPCFLDIFQEKMKGLNKENFMVVSPDMGGVDRARFFAKLLGANIAILDKRRYAKNKAHILNLIGDVENKHVLLFDDMIDTAGTICEAAKAVKEKGAIDVFVLATHAVLSEPACTRLANSQIDHLFLTDTIDISEEKQKSLGTKLEIVSVAKLFANAIRLVHNEESVNSLFVKVSEGPIVEG